jgi:hypothetical protein
MLVLAGVATLALVQTGAVDRSGLRSFLPSTGSGTDGDRQQPDAEPFVLRRGMTGSASDVEVDNASRRFEATRTSEQQLQSKRSADDAREQDQAKRLSEDSEAQAQAKRQAEKEAKAQAMRQAEAQAKRQAEQEAVARAKRQAEEAEAKRAEAVRAAQETGAPRALETTEVTGAAETPADKSIVVATSTAKDVPQKTELEPQQRSEFVRRIQAELRDRQCYSGAINGDITDGEGAIKALNVALEEDGRQIRRVEIRTASRDKIESWLRWLLGDLNNFRCGGEQVEPPPEPRRPA